VIVAGRPANGIMHSLNARGPGRQARPAIDIADHVPVTVFDLAQDYVSPSGTRLTLGLGHQARPSPDQDQESILASLARQRQIAAAELADAETLCSGPVRA
jgi:hypothetical protein